MRKEAAVYAATNSKAILRVRFKIGVDTQD